MKKAQQNRAGRPKRRHKSSVTVQRRRSPSGVAYVARYGTIAKPGAYRPAPDTQSGAPEVTLADLSCVGYGF